jgi:hypothetical protein
MEGGVMDRTDIAAVLLVGLMLIGGAAVKSGARLHSVGETLMMADQSLDQKR